ncbi:hypothetical protein CRUP_002434 [Coryphaenoides rupestris]|nr:hypothetical protein CRUP_002434 [Coryphaenoides rupestris]
MGVVYVERTLALIKPDAVHLAEEIEAVIVKSGFTVLQRRRLHLSPEQCADLYAEHHGRQLFPSLTVFMTSGPVVALELAHGHDAVSRWKAMLYVSPIPQGKGSKRILRKMREPNSAHWTN